MSGRARLLRHAPLLLAIGAAACAVKAPPSGQAPRPPGPARVETGEASWYGPTFHGRLTASGERYNMLDLTAAHRTLPFDTYVRVTHLETGLRLVVRVNDRGPFVRGRIIDLSYTAAKILGLPERGTGRVRVEALDPAEGARLHHRAAERVKREGVRTWTLSDCADVERRAGGS